MTDLGQMYIDIYTKHARVLKDGHLVAVPAASVPSTTWPLDRTLASSWVGEIESVPFRPTLWGTWRRGWRHFWLVWAAYFEIYVHVPGWWVVLQQRHYEWRMRGTPQGLVARAKANG